MRPKRAATECSTLLLWAPALKLLPPPLLLLRLQLLHARRSRHGVSARPRMQRWMMEVDWPAAPLG
jgi:hypothetical protein